MKKDEAVSPVIGVMLMIVVTVVIAAAVSAFAGNMGLDQKTGPSVNLQSELDLTSADSVTVSYYDDDGGGDYKIGDYLIFPNGGQHGILFTNMGGDPIDLKDLQIDVSSNDLNVLLDYDSTKTQASELPDWELGDLDNDGYPISRIDISDPSYTLDELKSMSAKSNKYFVKINPETSDDTIIRPGDQFKFCTDDQPGWSINWAIDARTGDGTYKGGSETFQIEPGTGNEWVLSHKPSGEILASGDFYFPDNN